MDRSKLKEETKQMITKVEVKQQKKLPQLEERKRRMEERMIDINEKAWKVNVCIENVHHHGGRRRGRRR